MNVSREMDRVVLWHQGAAVQLTSRSTDQNCAYTFPVAWLVCTLLLAGCET